MHQATNVDRLLRRIQARQLARIERELQGFADALQDWLGPFLAERWPDWRERFEAFLARQQELGRTVTPESRQSLVERLAWHADAFGRDETATSLASADRSGEPDGPFFTLLPLPGEAPPPGKSIAGDAAFREALAADQRRALFDSNFELPPAAYKTPPELAREPRVVEVKQLKGIWRHYDELVATGKYDPNLLTRGFYALARQVLPESAPSTRITFDDGTVLILLGGGPESGALGGQASSFVAARGMVAGARSSKELLSAALKHLGRESAEAVLDTAVQEATGLPVGPSALVPRKGKRAAPPQPSQSARSRRIKNLRRRSAEEVNAEFIQRGQHPPYHPRIAVREFTTARELRFVRVYEDPTYQGGHWMVRADAISGMTPEQVKQALGLEFVPKYITEVTVPAGTRMRVGIVGAQPQWEVTLRGIVQYELLEKIPKANFTNARSL